MRHLRLLIFALLTLIAPAVASAATRVTLQPGDTLDAIGQRYGVSAQAIASYNGLTNPGMVVAGTSLSIPSSSGGAGTTSTASSSGSYTVRPGENLGSIAARYGTTASAIARANGIANPNTIVAGTTIRISGGGSNYTSTSYASSSGSYTVQPGENLGSIAARYGTTASAIASANGIGNPNMVVAGTRLRVSGLARTVNASISTSSGGGYTVQPGENLGSIAARYGTTASAIARANGIANPNMVVAGTRLRISGVVRTVNASISTSSGSYTVRPGDNLGSIAARYGTTASAIARANGLSNANVVVAGTTLAIPAGTVTSTSSGTQTPVTAATSGWGTYAGRDQVAAMIDQSAATYGVDPALVRAIAWQESGWWQGARSSAGAVGVMQLMPDTASWLGPSVVGRTLDPTNTKDNIDGGAAYLAYLIRRTSTRDLAVASYYQGLGSVSSRGLYEDTKAYVGSVNTHYGVR